ncbi:MAG: dipeptidase PepV [Lachnospiraceae bacterium]|jgi:succinyl-diaminopimelate desuccinylase|nr:dipeptidase PepV [Lachnospiraceae bacterium]
MNTVSERLEAMELELIGALKRLVTIRSVENTGEGGTPFGIGVQRCLEEALQIGKELGFETVNMDDRVGWCEYGTGEEMIAVLGHLDVVPEADGWEYPPYEARTVGDRIVGRGTVDDKGPLAASLFALKAIRDAGIPLKRRIRILFGTNEETGSEDMEYYLAHGGEIPAAGFTPDGEYPLINGEKGIINETYERTMTQSGDFRLVRLEGGVAANVTPDFAMAQITGPKGYELPKAEKIQVIKNEDGWRVEARGVSAHGSHPEEGENAIGRLAIYLNGLPFEGEAAQALKFLAEKIGMDCFGTNLGAYLKDEISGNMTFNMGVLYGDDTKVGVKLNYRYPVTFEAKDCQPKVQQAFEEAGWVRTEQWHKEKLYVPEDSSLVQSLLKVYREATGDMSAPKSIGGGTYAKAIPNILAFGPIFPGDEVTEHCPNEYITVSRLMENAKIIAGAMIELAGKN